MEIESDSEDSAAIEWCIKHGIDVSDTESGLRLIVQADGDDALIAFDVRIEAYEVG